MSVRVAVVGCGRMGAERVAAAQACGAEVVAVADVDPERCDALAFASGAEAYSRVERMPWRSIDALFLCTPPAVRTEMVRLAAKHAIPILVEKPLGVDAPSASELVDLAGNFPVTAVGYMNRYRAGIAMAQRLARTHHVLGITCNWSCRQYRVPWWSDVAQSGGPVNEQATHIVDLCRFLGGEFTEVQAFADDRETRLCAALLLESGAMATLFYTCEASEKCISLELVTAGAHLRLNGWDFTPEGQVPDGISPFASETKAFLAAAAARGPAGVLCDFQDAYRTQLAVDCLRQKARSARAVAT